MEQGKQENWQAKPAKDGLGEKKGGAARKLCFDAAHLFTHLQLSCKTYVNKVIRPVKLLCLLKYIGFNNICMNMGISCGVSNIFTQYSDVYSILTCQQSVFLTIRS